MDYKKIGEQIMSLDPVIRFVTIFDVNDNIFFFEHRPGVTNLLTKEESKHSLQIALGAWKMRRTLQKQTNRKREVCTC